MGAPELRRATHRLLSTLAFGGCIAAVVVLVGTRDIEGYDLSFFSLSRGTAIHAVQVLGQPVYTLALGFGVRLPLHGNLGASPAAVLAPYLPYPLMYWVLLALSISAAALVVRHALEPLIGPTVSWLALVLLFCSISVINYTISNDWPENAVTYAAYVACVFAPHAMLALLASLASSAGRRLAGLAVAGSVWGLMALAHPGHWPLLAASLVLAGALALCRSDHPLRSRITVVAGLALVSVSVVALQAPDVLHEIQVAGDLIGMRRLVEGPKGSLLSANAFPFGELGSRSPFSFLLLALVSLLIGATSNDPGLRRLTVASALGSVLLGVAAATLSPGTSTYAPTITWALRDPAIVFAVFSGACAAAVLRRSRRGVRLIGPGLGFAALALTGLQGPACTAGLVLRELRGPSKRWSQDMTDPGTRAAKRGLAPDRIPPGERLVFWPAVREKMRYMRAPPTDFADAGYLLVTAWTKDRTMRGLIEEGNDHLFSQFVELPPRVLCDAHAVGFLQLRYLLLPPDVTCAPWSRVPDLLVDGWLQVGTATERDSRIRGLSIADLREPVAREPALSPRSELMSRLRPLSGTSLRLSSGRVEIRLDDPTVAEREALVVPVAYDSAWRTSSGRLHNLGGLVALTDVDQHEVAVEFRPDGVAVLRAVSMTLAQTLGLLGLLGLAYIPWAATEHALVLNVERLSRLIPVARLRQVLLVRLRQVLRSPRVWLYGAYSAAVIQHLDWRPAASDPSVPAALALPITAVLVARMAQRKWVHDLMGGTLFGLALITIAASGSRAARALHDPLFWSLVAIVAFGMSAVARRRQVLAGAASAAAGAATMLATLLPAFPDFEFTLPDVSLAAALRTLGMLSDRFGVLATASLLACWGHAIAVGAWRASRTRVGAATRGALVAGVILTLAGAVPETGAETAWIVALGILLGLGAASGAWQAVGTQRERSGIS